MRVLLIIIAAIALVASLGTCALAKGAPQEIGAQIWFLIFVVAGTGGGCARSAPADSRGTKVGDASGFEFS